MHLLDLPEDDGLDAQQKIDLELSAEIDRLHITGATRRLFRSQPKIGLMFGARLGYGLCMRHLVAHVESSKRENSVSP